MRYGDVQEKLRPRWPGAGVYGSGYWPTMQQLAFRLWGPGLRLNHGERVPHECVLSAAVSVGGNRSRRSEHTPLRSDRRRGRAGEMALEASQDPRRHGLAARFPAQQGRRVDPEPVGERLDGEPGPAAGDAEGRGPANPLDGEAGDLRQLPLPAAGIPS